MPESFNIVSLIRKKRDNDALSDREMKFIIQSYTDGEIPDYQMSAFLMASFLNGLNTEEASALTDSMLHSGLVVDLDEITGFKVDKHSTGGVGDKLSLILAPIVASCGVPVPDDFRARTGAYRRYTGQTGIDPRLFCGYGFGPI
ncbi:MAG: hypothetical protein U5K72_16260 [Balneolaceae bacterium]|nr:hypothetical protein [Balneolaceae bacterium]